MCRDQARSGDGHGCYGPGRRAAGDRETPVTVGATAATAGGARNPIIEIASVNATSSEVTHDLPRTANMLPLSSGIAVPEQTTTRHVARHISTNPPKFVQSITKKGPRACEGFASYPSSGSMITGVTTVSVVTLTTCIVAELLARMLKRRHRGTLSPERRVRRRVRAWPRRVRRSRWIPSTGRHRLC